MGKFSDKVNRFKDKALARTQAAFVNSVSHSHRSIVFGSTTTGSPGQVVQDQGGGNLRDSWQLQWLSRFKAKSTTQVPYAESNEDGIARPGGGPYIQRSAVGGRHSIQKTEDGMDRIVAYEVSLLRKGER